MATARTPVDVDMLPLSVVIDYVKFLREYRDVPKKKTVREKGTQVLLSYVKRPANLYPLVRLLFPNVSFRPLGLCHTGCHASEAHARDDNSINFTSV
jgi:hypothetical protein